MAEIIKLHDKDWCVECPQCGSQLFYTILMEDLETVDRIECGGFDIHGEPCTYAIKFDDDDSI